MKKTLGSVAEQAAKPGNGSCFCESQTVRHATLATSCICRRVLSYSLLGWALLPAALAQTEKVAVTHRISGCDYFIVYGSKSRYSVVEWFGGHDPDKGDTLVGRFDRYGMRTVLFGDGDDADETTRVYVEDYALSKEDALDKLLEKCE